MKANLIKRIASFALALCTAATLGCSGTGSAVSTATPEPTPTAQTLLQATPSPVPVKGGTLRLSMPVNADKTDPLEVNTEEMLMLYSLVFESLIEIDNKGMLVPGLAENWSVDETGTVWTLKLRSAARWHDTGAPVTAEDVVDTYRHIVSLGASSYYSYVTKHVASMEAAGDGTLTVRMKHQGLSALYALTFPVTENPSTGAERALRADIPRDGKSLHGNGQLSRGDGRIQVFICFGRRGEARAQRQLVETGAEHRFGGVLREGLKRRFTFILHGRPA